MVNRLRRRSVKSGLAERLPSIADTRSFICTPLVIASLLHASENPSRFAARPRANPSKAKSLVSDTSNYNEIRPKLRHQCGKPPRITPRQFGNPVRYQFGPQQLGGPLLCLQWPDFGSHLNISPVPPYVYLDLTG
jgi:hypothetical protein